MDLVEHFRIIWRRRYWVVLVSLVVAGAVYVWRSQSDDVYQAVSQVTVTAGSSVAAGDPLQEATSFLTKSYAQLGTTSPVLRDAVRASGLRISPSAARSRVDVSASPDLGVITVTARGPSPAAATKLNESVTLALIAAVRDRQKSINDEALAPLDDEIASVRDQLESLSDKDPTRSVVENQYNALIQARTARQMRPDNRVDVLAPASASSTPIAPTPQRDALFALLIALVVNAELAVGLNLLSDRFVSEDDTERVLDELHLPILARIPDQRAEFELVEAFRELRTSLLFMYPEDRRRRIAVTSIEPGAGKSFVSVHLAAAFTSIGMRSLLVDADLRSPTLHDAFGVPSTPGVSEVLIESENLENAIRRPPGKGITVLPAGAPVDDPSGLLATPEFRHTIIRAGEGSDVTIVDTPPTTLFADARAVARQCGAFLLVLDDSGARRSELREVVERLTQVGAQPLGVVVNRAKVQEKGSYYANERRNSESWLRVRVRPEAKHRPVGPPLRSP
jgi:capsular exopolysaccharide synthesis family protein